MHEEVLEEGNRMKVLYDATKLMMRKQQNGKILCTTFLTRHAESSAGIQKDETVYTLCPNS